MDLILFLTNLNAKIKNDNHSFTFKIKFGVYTALDGFFFFFKSSYFIYRSEQIYKEGRKGIRR